jgi:predicted GNAT family N-acyltransferase
MDNISVHIINSSSPEYRAVWGLREEVLRKPIGLSLKNEDLSKDHTDTIMVAKRGGEVIACLMLQEVNKQHVKLRQMAVSEEWQGHGIGKKLVIGAEKLCKENGYEKVILHARKVAVGFYRHLGYEVAGDEFSEVGIPHFLMEKSIN